MNRAKGFGRDLYMYLSQKYGMSHPSCNCEVCCDPEGTCVSDFTEDIGKAILMLSYTYRWKFRQQFEKLLNFENQKIITESENQFEDKFYLYGLLFARVAYQQQSSFKFLIICSFISELYLFRYKYLNGLYGDDKCVSYLKGTRICFINVFKHVFEKNFNRKSVWEHLIFTARNISKGYEALKPFMDTESVFSGIPFLTAVQKIGIFNSQSNLISNSILKRLNSVTKNLNSLQLPSEPIPRNRENLQPLCLQGENKECHSNIPSTLEEKDSSNHPACPKATSSQSLVNQTPHLNSYNENTVSLGCLSLKEQSMNIKKECNHNSDVENDISVSILSQSISEENDSYDIHQHASNHLYLTTCDASNSEGTKFSYDPNVGVQNHVSVVSSQDGKAVAAKKNSFLKDQSKNSEKEASQLNLDSENEVNIAVVDQMNLEKNAAIPKSVINHQFANWGLLNIEWTQLVIVPGNEIENQTLTLNSETIETDSAKDASPLKDQCRSCENEVTQRSPGNEIQIAQFEQLGSDENENRQNVINYELAYWDPTTSLGYFVPVLPVRDEETPLDPVSLDNQTAGENSISSDTPSILHTLDSLQISRNPDTEKNN